MVFLRFLIAGALMVSGSTALANLQNISDTDFRRFSRAASAAFQLHSSSRNAQEN
jgi:hypothetical protein